MLKKKFEKVYVSDFEGFANYLQEKKPKPDSFESFADTRLNPPLKSETPDPETVARMQATQQGAPGPMTNLPPVQQFAQDLGGGTNRMVAGMQQATGNLMGTLAKYADIISEKTGLPKGGLFDKLRDTMMKHAQESRDMSVQGIVGDVLEGLGGAGVDVSTIMSLGPYGLPIHGAITGGAEGGVKGAVQGAVQGGLTHGALKGIGELPIVPKLLASFGFGAGTTPGGVKERATGGFTWAMLGLAGGDKKVTTREFMENYPKIREKMTSVKLARLTKGAVKPKEIMEAGGPQVVMDELYQEWLEQAQVTSERKPEDIKTWVDEPRIQKPPPTMEIKVADNAVTMKYPDEVKYEKWLKGKDVLQDKSVRIPWTEIPREPKGFGNFVDKVEYQEKLDKARTTSARKPEEIKTWVEREWEPKDLVPVSDKEVEDFINSPDRVEADPVEIEIDKVTAPKLEQKHAGLPIPENVKSTAGDIAKILIDKLQVDPMFRRIGAEKTGVAAKAIASRATMGVEEARRTITELNKFEAKGLPIRRTGGLKFEKREGTYSDADFQELGFLAANPESLKNPAVRDKFGEGYKIVRKFYDTYQKRLKEVGIPADFPNDVMAKLNTHATALRSMIRAGRPKMMLPEKWAVKRAELVEETKKTMTMLSHLKGTPLKYTHIPKMWLSKMFEENPRQGINKLYELFHERETLDPRHLANRLLAEGAIKPIDTDTRVIMTAYAVEAERRIALAKLFETARGDGLIKNPNEAGAGFVRLSEQRFPTLSKEYVHPVLADYLEQQLLPPQKYSSRMVQQSPVLRTAVGGMRSMWGLAKVMAFYNPAILPAYDMYQAFWVGSNRSPKTPKYLRDTIKSMMTRDEHYQAMHEFAGVSTPFTPSFKDAVRETKDYINRYKVFNILKKIPLSPYKISWNVAWKADHFIRMMTYHKLLGEGASPMEAAQVTARVHGDYASIPPQTRRILNKIAFTPSFKIAMISAQSEMLSGFSKMVGNATMGKKGDITWKEKRMGKALVGLVAGVALRHATMKMLGFKTDFFGLKYTKEYEDENGEKRETTLYVATPDNVAMRYLYKFREFPVNQSEFDTFVNRTKWELHPAWQLATEVLMNKGEDFEPIYSPEFETRAEVATNVLKYSFNKIYRMSEIWTREGRASDENRSEAIKFLSKDFGKLVGGVLSWTSMPYTRTSEEKRVQYLIDGLKREFSEYMNGHPNITPESATKRVEILRAKIAKAIDRLK